MKKDPDEADHGEPWTVLSTSCGLCSALLMQNFFIPLAPFLAPNAWVGVLLALPTAVGCVLMPLVGAASDRRGGYQVFGYGLVLQAGAIVATAGAGEEVKFLIVARFLQGVASAAIFNGAMVLVMQQFGEPLRTSNLGAVLGVGVA